MILNKKFCLYLVIFFLFFVRSEESEESKISNEKFSHIYFTKHSVCRM